MSHQSLVVKVLQNIIELVGLNYNHSIHIELLKKLTEKYDSEFTMEIKEEGNLGKCFGETKQTSS